MSSRPPLLTLMPLAVQQAWSSSRREPTGRVLRNRLRQRASYWRLDGRHAVAGRKCEATRCRVPGTVAQSRMMGVTLARGPDAALIRPNEQTSDKAL
jgi:hypothetical protein